MLSSLIVGAAALLLAVAFGVEGAGYPLEARRLPELLVWIVAILAVMMLLEDFLKWRRRNRSGAAEREAEGATPAHPPVEWMAFVPFLAAAVAYVALMPSVGYLVITPLFIAGALLVARVLRPLSAVLCAVGLTGALWGIFIWVLHLPIPLLPHFA